MFDRDYKSRIEALEAELTQLKTKLDEVKQTLCQALGENHALRQENDHLKSFGIVPAKQINWADTLKQPPVSWRTP
jgi:regulator of replication initiation timing